MDTTELCYLPATQLAAAIRAKALSPTEVVDAFLKGGSFAGGKGLMGASPTALCRLLSVTSHTDSQIANSLVGLHVDAICQLTCESFASRPKFH